jgi:hypothetical protein
MLCDREESRMPDPARPDTDQTVPQTGNSHGSDGGYSGQEAGSFDNPTPAHTHVGASRGGLPAEPTAGSGAGQDGEDLPPEAGHRATVDQRTGEVHGSGAGAGGGSPGEDLDHDKGGATSR